MSASSIETLNPLPVPFQFSTNPLCTNDCIPIILSSRYCSSLFPDSSSFENITAYNRCFCNNPYILPLTTGLQCSFLCGHDNRAKIIDFIKGPLGCGTYPPWNTISSSIPDPESFAPDYSPAERWWRKWSDGERFGIILGCFLGAWFAGFFVFGMLQRSVQIAKNLRQNWKQSNVEWYNR
ncbi:hypothetical protein TWF569_004529 [Orbilia oligospora]|uniref:Uncharacterized protein n=1 Tax=Orbilia oligospora TaxID=2813651 RepID=A0A7C8JQQ2_ORBOL|nr:hypothetical protein TWF102_006067 [Orbilia oligospora]KAF3098576.1 hypothetical protein TWF103_009012 [Orbilia oligospora]KAF3126968.1 hypothetical protein TWF703_010259 [Orbilia oligospora]KAF3144274.1 hypothetical protein TWF594_004806 [Orbilia oligospora]KAF3150653.1 hypothetical protein TWF569_004529 [Orbilia oligospora]